MIHRINSLVIKNSCSQHWMNDEFRTVGLDDWSCIFGTEHMRQIGSLETERKSRKLMTSDLIDLNRSDR